MRRQRRQQSHDHLERTAPSENFQHIGLAGTREVTLRLLDALPPTSDRKALARDAAAAIANALSSVRGRDALEAPRT